MPITDRFVHALAIVTPTADADGTLDEYGQPVAGIPTTTLVSGLIQPKSAREVALVNQAGAQLSDHTIFLLRSAPVETASYVRYQPDDGDRYEVTGIRDFNYGTGNDHLEVDARRVHAESLVAS